MLCLTQFQFCCINFNNTFITGNISDTPKDDKEAKASRRNSVATKRHSVIRLLSESESHDNLHEKLVQEAENNGNANSEVINENDEENDTTPTRASTADLGK